MYIKKKFRGFLGTAVAFSLFTAGCSANSPENSGSVSDTESIATDADDSSTSQEKITELSNEASLYQSNVSEIFSERDLNADYDELTADISLTGSSAEISGKGAAESGIPKGLFTLWRSPEAEPLVGCGATPHNKKSSKSSAAMIYGHSSITSLDLPDKVINYAIFNFI